MAEPNDSIDSNVNVFGKQTYFNEDTKFFKDVYIYGTLFYDLSNKGVEEIFKEDVDFEKDVLIKGDLTVEGNADVGILTVRKRLDVGIGGTVLRAIADLEGLPFTSGKVGIGSTSPQQALDVSGSIKIDANIFDSVNSPGKNGYQLSRDVKGIRWIAMFPQGVTPGVGFGTIVGIQTDGFFVLDEGIPIF